MNLARKLSFSIPCLVAGCLTVSCAGCSAVRHAERINTRQDVTVRLEILEPKDVQPIGTVILFPGGGGDIDPHNFVVRTAPQFVQLGYVAVLMDSPSDQRNMTGKYRRESQEHFGDMLKVIEHVHGRYAQIPLFLLAFSMGNVSASTLAAKSGDLKISGIIFMGGPWQFNEDNQIQDRFSKIPYPVLLVHHENDACRACLFAGARKYYDLVETKGRKDFLAVRGGTLISRIGGDCGPYHYHAFEGLEEKVVVTVVDWMNGAKIPERIP